MLEFSFEETENVCWYCIENDHEKCSSYTYGYEEACACRNSDHTLDNRNGPSPELIERWQNMLNETEERTASARL